MPEPRLIERGARLAAVPISDTSHPDAPEVDRLGPRAIGPRRASFVAGRRAARGALGRHWGTLPEALRVDAEASGRPQIWVAGRRSPTQISISHAGGWAIAAVSEAPLGVDLVELETLPESLEAFAPGELARFRVVLPNHDPRLALCIAFAAKEAALKWLGVGMALPLASVRVEPTAIAEGEAPWSIPVRLEHPAGQVDLGANVWSVIGELWCVLLGGEVRARLRGSELR